MNDKPNCGLISKYRTILMGLAIIFIMFCHMDTAMMHNGLTVTPIAKAMHFFTVGVDIFLFLSGVGLYYSYTKKKQPYVQFEKKRLFRILPQYFLIAGITYLISDFCIKQLPFEKFLNDWLFMSWFKEGILRYWYILTIVVFYLLFPPLYKFIHSGKNAFAKTFSFAVCWWVFTEILYAVFPYTEQFKIAAARLPIFVFGIYCGKLAYEKAELGRMNFLLLPAGYLAFIFLKMPFIKPLSRTLYYPVRALLAISITATVIVVMEFMENRSPKMNAAAVNILGWFGGLTLELYLLHQSYMILFGSPYRPAGYFSAAFLLPSVTACGIYLCKKYLRKESQ